MTSERDPSPIGPERYPLQQLLAENPQHPLHQPGVHSSERDPLTPALLQEASIPPTWHAMILSLRPPSCSPTPATSSAASALTTTGTRRERRIASARAANRIGADDPKPISPETYIEHRIILAVIADRRRIGGVWAGWAAEARDIIDQVIPTRRQQLQDYADMRALIRRRRTIWKLAEHITVLDPVLDSFP